MLNKFLVISIVFGALVGSGLVYSTYYLYEKGKMTGCLKAADYFLTGLVPSFVENLQIKGQYEQTINNACKDIITFE